jgi:CDP-diacylglycerol--serine O-phosphatidyltransferase
MVTMVALACGLAALEAARLTAWDFALWLILLAAIADGVDGMLARQLWATSAMGEQLDSLADIVAFGTAPAFLFWTHYGGAPGALRFGVAFAFVLAGAYRLARFHAQPTEGAFRGLPITVAGPLLALAVAGPFGLGARGAGSIGIGLAALMVHDHSFPTFAPSRRWLLAAIAAASVLVGFWPRVETLAIVAVLTLGTYTVWGLIGQAGKDEALGD